jgi:protein phosphatase 1L
MSTKKKIIINCGDCRAISHNTDTIQQVHALSNDHCASNPSEKKRALEAGAVISYERIDGVMEPFRSIGDIDMKTETKKNWVIATPEVHISTLEEEETTIILATDGIWSVLSNEEVMEIAKKHLEPLPQCTPKNAADGIKKIAIERGSYDDISIVVIQL